MFLEPALFSVFSSFLCQLFLDRNHFARQLQPYASENIHFLELTIKDIRNTGSLQEGLYVLRKYGSKTLLSREKRQDRSFLLLYMFRSTEPCSTDLSFLVFSSKPRSDSALRKSHDPIFSKIITTVPCLNLIWTVCHSPR